jgi:hypothetical protein
MCILLRGHPDYDTGQVTYANIPSRLADNLKTGYAIVFSWTTERITLQKMIELALDKRTTHDDKSDNTRVKMMNDTCA